MRTIETSQSSQKSLGILWVVYGIICLAEAAWMFLNTPVLTVMWGAIITRVPNPFAWMDFFHLALVGAIVFAVVTALVALLAGLGMLGGSSNRTLALVAAIFGLIHGPLGIALGAYTLAVFVRPTTVSDYRMPAAA